MKLKNIGKVYPSPSASSCDDYLSILKLLPAAILALASVLSLEDRQVLAYMITRSLKTTTTTTTTAANSSLLSQDKKKTPKKPPPPSAAVKMTQKGCGSSHKPPVFDCDCFDCYTSFWFRWDSSPNRELIHQVIEAFEDHLTNGESNKPSKKNSRLKRKDGSSKRTTRVVDVPVVEQPGQPDIEVPVVEPPGQPDIEVPFVEQPGQPDIEVPVLEFSNQENAPFFSDVTSMGSKEEVVETAQVAEEFTVEVLSTETAAAAATISNHKGLARKVLPDVLGLFNSRLWGLWSPNV